MNINYPKFITTVSIGISVALNVYGKVQFIPDTIGMQLKKVVLNNQPQNLFYIFLGSYQEDLQFQPKIKKTKKAKRELPLPIKQDKNKKQKRRKRMVVKTTRSQIPNIIMPKISGAKPAVSSKKEISDDPGNLSFSIPEITFMGAKSKEEKVCFLIHFGISTTSIGAVANPYTRMTAYTIQNRLADLIKNLPENILFNIACFWEFDTGAMSPKLLPATSANKQMVYDWMKHANPLEGNYSHNFQSYNRNTEIQIAKNNWPTKVDNLSMPSVSWIYPYVVPKSKLKKYCPDAVRNFHHWNRALAWAILTQKPNAIFLLTNNYVGDCYTRSSPIKMRKVFKKMLIDVYGEDKMSWPSINVIILPMTRRMKKDLFDPLIILTDGDRSLVENITNYMTPKEKEIYKKYKKQYTE